MSNNVPSFFSPPSSSLLLPPFLFREGKMKRYHFRLAEVLGSLAVAALVLVILIVGLVLGLPSRFQTRVPSLQAHDGTTLTGKYLASYDQEVWYGEYDNIP